MAITKRLIQRHEEFGESGGKKKCMKCNQTMSVDFFTRLHTGFDGYNYYCKACRKSESHSEAIYKSKMLSRAKKRAQEQGVPFTLVPTDLIIPDTCPVLNIKLSFGGGVAERANSPSIDRLVPMLGYVPGNITVISHRANLLKNNSTLDELIQIVEWMKAR